MSAPYKTHQLLSSDYWVCVDTRHGEPVSYPTSKAAAKRETAFMNRTYRQLAQQAA